MLSDHEMQYYQFKARQAFLLQKENDEWERFCDQTAQSEISKEKMAKDIGVQVSQTRIQIIPSKNVSIDHRSEIIQRSLKNSFERLKNMHPSKPKSTSSVNLKLKNKSFFLPHNLKQQRIISRRSYEASLSKPNIISKSEKMKTNKNELIMKNATAGIKYHSSTAQLQGRKLVTKSQPVLLPPEPYEEFSSSNTKMQDSNIENAIDGILDDLLGETALSLMKIESKKENKYHRTLNVLSETVKNIEEERTKMFAKWNLSNLNAQAHPVLSVSAEKVNDKTTQHLLHRHSLRNQISSFPSYESDVHTVLEDFPSLHITPPLDNRSTLQNLPKNMTLSKSTINHTMQRSKDYKNIFQGLSEYKTISVDPKEAENIAQYRKEFGTYLKRISHVETESFNPWKVANMVADALLDDCFCDIAYELNELPSNMVNNLYNQEFIQSV